MSLIGECLICGAFTDNPDDFTCGNPQCNKELRERVKKFDHAGDVDDVDPE